MPSFMVGDLVEFWGQVWRIEEERDDMRLRISHTSPCGDIIQEIVTRGQIEGLIEEIVTRNQVEGLADAAARNAAA